ncbi:hypothetical protein SDC9_69692 [bioreactor metagenome]|jgi:hypothetical protein|uniref:DUF4402 domain-containing protein n=1 Tax=bioreactor metagenome TaxID=1076179 RepID=A0A644Y4V8_9ZZZZ
MIVCKKTFFLLPLIFSLFITKITSAQLLQATASGYIDKIQDLQFGSFYPGSSGGTITVSTNGTRSSNGSFVFLPGYPANQAQFKFTMSRLFGFVNINITADNLTRVGGGGTLPLTVSYTPQSFFTWLYRVTYINVGGTLTISPTSLPGAYIGNIYITEISQ